MNRTEALDEVMSTAVGFISEVFDGFTDPQEDITPVLLIAGKDDMRVLVDLDGKFLDTGLTKDVLAELVMPELIREHNGIAACFFSSAWVVVTSKEDPHPEPPYDDHPDRIEQVMIYGATVEEMRVSVAKILRDGEQPPVLGEWDHRSDMELEGRFPMALARGLAGQG